MGIKNFRCWHPPTLSDDEDATILHQERNINEEDIDEVINFIEARLNAIDLNDKSLILLLQPQDSTSGVETNTTSDGVDSSIKYGYHILKNVLKRAKKHASKILSRENQMVVTDILRETAQINWVVAGLGVVAYMMEQMDKISNNREESIRLLRQLCALARQIKQLDRHLNQKKLTDVVVFIVKGSFFCISQMQGSKFSRFFSAPMDAEQLRTLQSDLEHTYPDLSLDGIVKLLNRTETIPPLRRENPNAVGIDEAQDKVMELLDLKDEKPRAVVLYGIGGIGKTTLATAVFSSLKLKDYKCCRINIEQDSSDSDVKQLQEQILRDLFDKRFQLSNSEQGKTELSYLFTGGSTQPLFLYIDNALRAIDLAKFLPLDISRLPSRSRVLITTRNLDVTDIINEGPGGVMGCPYIVESLSDAESKRLLRSKALGNVDNFSDELDIDRLVKICGGVPRVLQEAGSILLQERNNDHPYEATIEFFKDTLVRGEGKLSEEVVDLVYNSLQEDLYKDAFLDIAAFFNNWDQRIVSYIVGVRAFKAIQKTALVRISEEGKVIVHDIVLARGRKLSEVNRITDHISYKRALINIERLEKLKGIWLPPPVDSREFRLEANHLESMKETVRVLHLGERNKLNGETKEKFPNLRLLHVSGSLTIELTNLERLAVLQADLDNYDGSTGCLRPLNFPSSVHLLKLCGYSLPRLSENFVHLSHMKELYLSSRSVSLPDRFGELQSLRFLDIVECPELKRLPENFGLLKCLEVLNISKCRELVSLPQSFSQLNRLKELNISDCPLLDGKTMDMLVEMKSLLVLKIPRSPMLVKRWKEIKEILALLVLDRETRLHEHSVSRALFRKESEFLQNDGDVQFDGWSPKQGEVAFVLSMCDLSSPSNGVALGMLKGKIAELASQGFQIVYVCVGQIWNQNSQHIRQSLVHLPPGSWAWIAPDETWNMLAGYSIYQLSNNREEMVSSLHTLIASARVSINQKGEKYVEDIKLAFPVSGDVEGLEDSEGGFSGLFFPIREMKKKFAEFERRFGGNNLAEENGDQILNDQRAHMISEIEEIF